MFKPPRLLIPIQLSTKFLNHRGDDLADAALQFAIVCDGCAHGGLGGSDGRNTQID